MAGDADAIDRTLRMAYGLSNSGCTAEPESPLLAAVLGLVRIYSESTRVEPIRIMSADDVAFVMTSEETLLGPEPKTWRGIHVWRFDRGQVARFEAYGQTLIVVPPGGGLSS